MKRPNHILFRVITESHLGPSLLPFPLIRAYLSILQDRSIIMPIPDDPTPPRAKAIDCTRLYCPPIRAM